MIATCIVSYALDLFTVFLVLKVTKRVSWSWFWVTSPIWITPCVSFLAGFVGGVISGIQSQVR